jgi:hypothetical protein
MNTKIAFTLIIGAAVFTHGSAFAGGDTHIVQPDFPKIIRQPEDQMAGFGSNATFTVAAGNTESFQWLRDETPLDGQTNASLRLTHCGINDVGYYACNLYKGIETVPTRRASLMVYTSSIDPQTGVDPIVVFGPPVLASGGTGTCPGHYAGYVNYTKSVTNGWGWAPDTNNGNTIFTASDTNRTNTKIEYVGEFGNNGCNQATVTIPNPPISPVFRFSIYFTNNVPTNAYPITLGGFNP